jgi:hypothetical protein
MLDASVYDAILVMVDRYIKIALYIPCTKTCTAEELAGLLERHIVRRFSMPNSIISDRGSVFTSGF